MKLLKLCNDTLVQMPVEVLDSINIQLNRYSNVKKELNKANKKIDTLKREIVILDTTVMYFENISLCDSIIDKKNRIISRQAFEITKRQGYVNRVNKKIKKQRRTLIGGSIGAGILILLLLIL